MRGRSQYVVFNRYTDELRIFRLEGSRYIEIELRQPRLWLPDIQLGLGLWQGNYQGIERQWLRWYDVMSQWVLTPTEQEQQRAEQERQRAEQERQRAEQERQRAERLIEQLRSLGIEPDLSSE